MSEPAELLRLEGVSKVFVSRPSLLRRRRKRVRAVDDVSLALHAGETVAVVGESGSGKSTLLRVVLGLLPADEGRILFRGADVTHARGAQRRAFRRDVQMVFQDAAAALSPRMTAGQVVEEPMVVHSVGSRRERRRRARELLTLVGLRERDAERYPHEFSGGQRQRISIARALSLDPSGLLLDEPVAALDVSTQAQVLNLLADLQGRLGLAYLFVSHDLSIVHHVANRVVVMYLGRVVEHGTADQIFVRPHHPYTTALLSAVPVSDPAEREHGRRILLTGELPNPAKPPSGCVFRTRCWKATDRCAAERPPLATPEGGDHPAACHYPENVSSGSTAPLADERRTTAP